MSSLARLAPVLAGDPWNLWTAAWAVRPGGRAGRDARGGPRRTKAVLENRQPARKVGNL